METAFVLSAAMTTAVAQVNARNTSTKRKRKTF